MLKNYKIPVLDAKLATSASEAAALAKKYAKAVALKISSADVSHKTDAGGVKLNLAKQQEVRDAYADILKSVKKFSPKAKIDGVTVSPMAKPGGMEVILGMIKDPQYGPSLMFGLGGIFTEIYKDVQFCLLPASEKELKQMIRSIKGYPLISGIRGQKPKDEKALIDLMKAIAKLVKDHPEIDQIDLNPVMLYNKGLSVADYRIYTK
jgi:acyl-CoA synthetase (NDP forming)